MKTHFLILFSTISSLMGLSQTVYKLEFSNPKKAVEKNFPFANVEVLDTRSDTTTVFTNTSGEYPRLFYKFTPTLSIAFEKTIKNIGLPFPTSGPTVMINIKQFRIPNKQTLNRRTSNGKRYRKDVRAFLLVSADFYLKKDSGMYIPFGSFEKEELIFGKFFKNLSIFRSIVHSIRSQYHDGILAPPIPIDKIIETTKNTWFDLPIFSDTTSRTGLFFTFSDFQHNQISADTFSLTLSTDSLYDLNFPGQKWVAAKNLPYAVRYEGNLFIQLSDKKYLPLKKERDTFTCKLPYQLPNFYELMAYESLNSDHGSHTTSSGNILGDLAGSIIKAAVNQSTKSNKKEKLDNNAQHDKYRSAFIDMYSGDLLF